MGPAFFYSEVKLRELNDLDLRQVLTVTVGAVIALALLELEDEDLLALELLDDLGSDLLVLQGGSVNDGLLAVVQEKDGELDLVARLRVELLDVERIRPFLSVRSYH